MRITIVSLAVAGLVGLGAGQCPTADADEACLGHRKDVAKSGSHCRAMQTGDHGRTTNAADRLPGMKSPETSRHFGTVVDPVSKVGFRERRRSGHDAGADLMWCGNGV